ncbi:MAG TPA: hypothetical protein VJ852_13070, partial [Gemmatimonadaceae bacterium]|nr:hypothetical protein [Gemmatimonadaceae bacterium]
MNFSRPSLGVLMLCVATAVPAQSPSYPNPAETGAATQGNATRSGQVTLAAHNMRASRATGAINIDGKLDEPTWQSAVPSTDFTQSYPKVGAPPTDRTEVRVLYDDDALYVGVRMFDSRP